MSNTLAEQIIAARNVEKAKQQNMLNLYQQVADLMFPRENQITAQRSPGEDKSLKIYDGTAIRDSERMCGGLVSALIPFGQQFFGLHLADKALDQNPDVRRYMAEATRVTHQEMYASNFMMNFAETIRALAVLGTGCIYSEWNSRIGRLNYKEYGIEHYQIKENEAGVVDTVFLSFMLTARQAVQRWGSEKVGEKVGKAAAELKDESKKFEFIHLVRPRSSLNPLLSDNLNMPFESIVVNVADCAVVEESGFDENPFAVARWQKSSYEKYGRGQGTTALSDVKTLQATVRSRTQLAARLSEPPLTVNKSLLEGRPDMRPNALNYVMGEGAIRGVDAGAQGNFPVAVDTVEDIRQQIHDAFYMDVFNQFNDLTGDRRTTVEIRARAQEALKKLVLPVSRLQSELMEPLITRSVMLLVRNGRLLLPPELEGQEFTIEYLGQISLALRDQEAAGFMQFAEFAGQAALVAPQVLDMINWDAAMVDVAESMGVKPENLATPQQIAATRQARAEQAQAAQLMQAGQAAGKTNTGLAKAPEQGSPGAALMEMMQ